MEVNNQLPKDWKWVKLGDTLDIQGGSQPPKSKFIYEPEPGYIQLLQIRDFGERGLPTYVPEKLVTKFCKKDDIMIARYGASLGRIMTGLEGAYNVAIAKVIDKNQLFERRYIYYLLKTQIFQTPLKLLSRSAQNGFSKGEISHINLPLPPKTTQLAIVSKIEELFSEIENGIKSLFTAKEQLKKYRQSVLKWAFEGKLTNGLNGDLYDLPDEHDLSIAAESETEYGIERNHNNQKNQKNHSSDAGELPEGWKWAKTIDVIHVINNGYTPTKEFLSEGVGEIPFIKVYNLNFNGTLNFQKNPTFIPDAIHKKDLKRSICFPGDVLINIVGPPLGKVSIVSNQFPQWNINQAIVMFRPNEKVISKYISYFMQNPVTINWLENTSKATAGQWNVKVSTCREIPFPFCSKVEQQKVVEAIESRLSVADKMEESITESLQQAEALKQSILKKAFEGKLV